ncbi:MAG: shikimate kinase AroK [Pseudomonadota bacterium]
MKNLILIGPMGAGKTTVGRQLSQRLKREFYDSDKEIEKRTGVDIPTIFEYEGEDGFRSREEAVIDELTQKDAIVLATGGGAVMRPLNRERLRKRGRIVFLNVAIDEQLERTRMDKSRPLLQCENPREKLENLREERLPIYRSIADFEIKSDSRNMKVVINKICNFLKEHGEYRATTKQL